MGCPANTIIIIITIIMMIMIMKTIIMITIIMITMIMITIIMITMIMITIIMITIIITSVLPPLPPPATLTVIHSASPVYRKVSLARPRKISNIWC